jgi:hypothetical protein
MLLSAMKYCLPETIATTGRANFMIQGAAGFMIDCPGFFTRRIVPFR